MASHIGIGRRQCRLEKRDYLLTSHGFDQFLPHLRSSDQPESTTQPVRWIRDNNSNSVVYRSIEHGAKRSVDDANAVASQRLADFLHRCALGDPFDLAFPEFLR